MKRRIFLATTGLSLALAVASSTAAWAENAKLKIGFVGVTSGPAAAWGISNQRSMETRAAWLNELGGVMIGDTTYDIEIVPFDEVSAEHAYLEGEGDRSLATWRKAHERFFTEHAVHARGFSRDMPVVLQRFAVLYSHSSAGKDN